MARGAPTDQGKANSARQARPGRPRALPVATEPLSDGEAFWRLKSRRALTPAHRGHNSFQAFRVLAFCVEWQRTGGTIEGIVASEYCSRRTAFTRLASCRGAGFEPDLVLWSDGSKEEWQDLVDNTVRHMDDDFARELAEYRGRPLVSRLVRRRPEPHDDRTEDTSE